MKDYRSMSEEALVALCRTQDEKAWRILFERYLHLTTAIAAGFPSDELETEDLVSEGLFGFLSAVKTFQQDADAGFRTYAAVCIKNRMRNALKAAQAKRVVPSRQCVPLEGQEFPDENGDPARAAIAKEESTQLMQLIRDVLSPQERTVFFMRLGGSSYQQIAERTALSVKAVDGTLQRARKKLQQQISQHVLSQS